MTEKEKLVQRVLDMSGDMPSREKFAHYLMQCADNDLRDRLRAMENDRDRRGAFGIKQKEKR
jgi:hypothetical protein